ncbi:MAG: ATP-binding cassette domain-containing protein, partial [Oscillospiraceae bacterium]|nr:ATP-binding cassette domain-containing protein [Oscillospiraceae bacterium]
MESIKTVGLTKKYKRLTAVDGLDITINKGELFSLLGVNGAGKTTTIKMLSCLAKPTSGNAFVEGKNIKTEEAHIKRVIGVSPQETAIAPNISV